MALLHHYKTAAIVLSIGIYIALPLYCIRK